VEDRVFGPVVMFGHGGTAVEVLNDTTLELPPLNMALARAQIARSRVWRLLQGLSGAAFRRPRRHRSDADPDRPACGRSCGDRRARHQSAAGRGRARRDALDARIALAEASTAGRGRLAISPYPSEFEKCRHVARRHENSTSAGASGRRAPADIVANMTRPIDDDASSCR